MNMQSTETQNTNAPLAGTDIREEIDTIEHAVDAIVRLGRIWAKHGLEVAAQTVKTTSETLQVTADTLRETSKRLGEKHADS